MLSREGKVLRVLFLTLALVLLLVLVTGSDEVEGKTITVDDDGGADYEKIQDAINASEGGDRIEVKPGTYTENVKVNKSVTVIAEPGNYDDTFVTAALNDRPVFEIVSDDVTLSGFNISGASEQTAGIFLEGRENCSIGINFLTGNYHGILAQNCRNSTILSNWMTGNTGWAALAVTNQCEYVILEGNFIINNSNIGIYLGIDCRYNLLEENFLVRNTGGNESFGIFLDHDASFNWITYNYGWKNEKGIVLNDGCDGNNISNNNIYDNLDSGIVLMNMFPGSETGNSNNTVIYNEIWGNAIAVNISGGSKDNMVTRNEITGNVIGVKVSGGSTDNTITWNGITDSTELGMDASDNKDQSVDARDNWWGDDSGPYHSVNNTGGKGDAVTDYVDFDPWLQDIGNKIPVVTITSPANNTGVPEFVIIKGTVQDDNQRPGVEISIDGGEWIHLGYTKYWTYTWDTRKVENGKHVISVRASDGMDHSEVENLTLWVNNDYGDDESFLPAFDVALLAVAVVLGAVGSGNRLNRRRDTRSVERRMNCGSLRFEKGVSIIVRKRKRKRD